MKVLRNIHDTKTFVVKIINVKYFELRAIVGLKEISNTITKSLFINKCKTFKKYNFCLLQFSFRQLGDTVPMNMALYLL